MAKSHPDSYVMGTDILERFQDINEQELEHSGGALLSFFRERSFRGNARKFRIYLDGREAGQIGMDSQCSIPCQPGFHKLFIKLDSLKSPLLNIKAEAGKRYYFDIACTMEDGMVLKQLKGKEPERNKE